MKNTPSIFSLVFSSIGVLLLSIGAYQINNVNNFAKKTVTIRAVVSKLHHNSSGTSCAEFSFKYESKNYNLIGGVCSSPPNFYKGEVVEVLFDPKKPKEVIPNTFFEKYFTAIFISLFGIPFLGIGLHIIFSAFLKNLLKKKLVLLGVKQITKITAIDKNTDISFNGKFPFNIVCVFQNPSTGEKIMARSDDLNFDPVKVGLVSIGDEIEVYFDPKDPYRNYVNIDHIIKSAA